MRSFGVEEELLLVDALSLRPLPAAQLVIEGHEQSNRVGFRGPGEAHRVTVELQQEQIEVISPPQTTLSAQVRAMQHGRALAEVAAVAAGARTVALSTAPHWFVPHPVVEERFLRIMNRFGVTAREQFTCGFHVHVGIESRAEGIGILDRIRPWLPVLLALSSNSAFCNGTHTGYNSFRYQTWCRWPTSGPNPIFGSVQEYDRHCRDLLSTGVPLDEGMLYFDARLSHHLPTIEVRIADVCLKSEQGAVIAAIIRAFVEVSARAWRAGVAPLPVQTNTLRAWTWQASRWGVDHDLIDPFTGIPAPASVVIKRLLDQIQLVLQEYEEYEEVSRVIEDIVREGSGARRQRDAFRLSGNLDDVIRLGLTPTRSVSS